MKKLLTFVLMVCLIVGLMPMAAYAESDKPVFYLEYAAKDTGHTEGPGGIRVEMKAGDEPKYWVTGEFDAANYAGYYFMKEGTAAEWNVKLEYPENGIPTVTLKNAKINKVYRGLAFTGGGDQGEAGQGGYVGHSKSTAFNGDVKLVLEGENHIDNCHRFAQILYFHVNGTATITGSGSLSINHSTNQGAYGIIHAKGDLVFDNTKVSIKVPSVESRHGMGIVAHGGDITVKGGTLFFDGHNEYPSGKGDAAYTKFRNIAYALWAAKNADGKGGSFNVQDNADVQIYASHVNASVGYYKWTRDSGTEVTPQVKGMVRLDNALNISDSKVIFAVTAGTSSSSGGSIELYNESLEVKRIGVKFNFDFDEGYTVSVASGHTSIDNTTGAITTPKSVKTFANQIPDYSSSSSTQHFFMVTPGFVEPEPEPEPEPKPEPEPEPKPDDTQNTPKPDDNANNDTGNAQPSEPTPPAEDVVDQENTTPESVPVTEPVAAETTGVTEAEAEAAPKEKKNMGILVLIAGLSVAALVGAGAAVYVFIIKPKKK